VALKARTSAIARNITHFLKKTDRFAKTIIFCVDQEHADEMRRALNNLNDDLVKQYPDYVCRVTSEEGPIGKGHLSKFQELETTTPVILTTSQLLTTGVDIPTCKNIVIARVVNSMVEFKQIIGRGTRVRDDYGKLFFNILDYTGSATRLFADPEFDGEPAYVSEEQMTETGESISHITVTDTVASEDEGGANVNIADDSEGARRKYYCDRGYVEIAAHLVYELDPDGR
jgi:type I restriction enzyme R subunit